MKYSATKVNFITLEKKLNRLFKKLDACGGTYRFSVLDEYTKEVPVYSIDEFTQTKIQVDTAFVECVDFELEFDPYKVGDYFVGAVVERTADDNLNAVYCIDTTTDFSQYRKDNLLVIIARQDIIVQKLSFLLIVTLVSRRWLAELVCTISLDGVQKVFFTILEILRKFSSKT